MLGLSEITTAAHTASQIVASEAPRAADAVEAVPRVTAIIPARNEAATIGAVVDAARGASLVDHVIVVDSASSDATGAIAADHGATVVRMAAAGKGQAMAGGVAESRSPYIVFLDGDLTNLRPDHVDGLVRPMLEGDVAQTTGTFDRGTLVNTLMRYTLPNLTGQRGMHRSLFESLRAKDAVGWRTEAAINAAAARTGKRQVNVVLDGMFHRTKEEKLSSPLEGFLQKSKMLGIAGWASFEYGLRNTLHMHGTGGESLVDSVRGAYSVQPAKELSSAA